MKQVDIALATYNGELFIREQIESIQKQSYYNWRLLISDDGSTDSTINIIKELMQSDSRIDIVNDSRQGGVIKNFNKALMHTTAEYILLCDQDDIWPPERLSKLVNEISCIESEKVNSAVMIFTDLCLIDEKNNTISESFYKVNKINPESNLQVNKLYWNSSVYGCTVIMNRKLLDVSLPIPEFAHMHDQWLALNASRSESLYYLEYPSVLYRQHTGNVVGGRKKSWLQKIKSLKKNLKTISKNIDNTIACLKHEANKTHEGYNINTIVSSFAFKEVLPSVFSGNRKIFSLLIFIGLMIKR
ncbi:glycosyltransferase family 2 protein [Enterobacter roggenkampii]|uniref:glycosyltransferase family 2 protein n=1 Tax=Enterobacter roggenkampii TaxID=1812935 RepID=UPI001E50D885|nr:glycosyltransferase family 2 protein [Enterobacter roggenkampii]MCE1463950.1 glycosyltransferase family 2 protein [Enterobacter roggenkampii]